MGAATGGIINASLTPADVNAWGWRIPFIGSVVFLIAGYLLRRGPLSPDIGRIDGAAVNEQRWRKTLMLFTPVTAPMRADPRFEPLMRDLGLAEYWRLSGTDPDYRRG